MFLDLVFILLCRSRSIEVYRIFFKAYSVFLAFYVSGSTGNPGPIYWLGGWQDSYETAGNHLRGKAWNTKQGNTQGPKSRKPQQMSQIFSYKGMD